MLQAYQYTLVNNTLSQIFTCRDVLFGTMQSLEKIQDLVNAFKFCVSSLFFSDPKTTPLHIAARQGNVKILNHLLSAGFDINAVDKDGLSPLHLAAVHGHAYAIGTLLDKGADPSLLSKFGGSFADYLRMTSRFIKLKEPIKALSSLNMSYSTHTADKLQVAPQCLRQGVVLTHENVARPEVLAPLVHSDMSLRSKHIGILKLMVPDQFLSYFLERYEEFKKNPPALSISKVIKKSLRSDMCGLVAKQKISKGSVIAEYTGEIKPDDYPSSSFKDDTYLLSEPPVIDSIQYRSSASMVNHGFPNSHLVSLGREKYTQGLDGLPFRHVLIATEDISEGEEIIWNYGPEYLGGSHLVELRPKALEHFLKTVSWKEQIKALKQYGAGEIAEEKLLQTFDTVYKFKYLTESPSSLEFAVKNKYLKINDLRQFYKASIDPSLPLLGKILIENFLVRATAIFSRDKEL